MHWCQSWVYCWSTLCVVWVVIIIINAFMLWCCWRNSSQIEIVHCLPLLNEPLQIHPHFWLKNNTWRKSYDIKPSSQQTRFPWWYRLRNCASFLWLLKAIFHHGPFVIASIRIYIGMFTRRSPPTSFIRHALPNAIWSDKIIHIDAAYSKCKCCTTVDFHKFVSFARTFTATRSFTTSQRYVWCMMCVRDFLKFHTL